jgi:predicted nuclease of predicted toxin-antitoxin system
MLIKLDEHLPRRLVSVLSAFGHDVDTVDIEGLKGADDDSVWTAAQSANRFLITQDLDFSDNSTLSSRDASGASSGALADAGSSSLTRSYLGSVCS